MKKTIICVFLGLTVLFGYLLFIPSPNIKNTNPSGENIICFGDSLAYGTGSTPGMDYPSQLSSMISRPIINAGVPGDTTARSLARLKKDVLSRSPRIVLVTLGGNDLKNGVPLEQARVNLKLIIESIQNQGTLVILGGIDIPFLGKGFGKIYEQLSDELGAVLIPNVLSGIIGNPKLMSDRIHPNDDGYALMAGMFYKAIKPYI